MIDKLAFKERPNWARFQELFDMRNFTLGQVLRAETRFKFQKALTSFSLTILEKQQQQKYSLPCSHHQGLRPL